MKKFVTLCLCGTLILSAPASAYGLYREDNPFVEAMLRMMEIFGLIDRDSLPLGAPYLPGYGASSLPALGGLSGLGGYPGMSGVPGMSPWSGMTGYPGMGGIPGMSPWSGMAGYPGMSGVPGMSPWSGLGGSPGMGQMPGIGGWPAAGMPNAAGVPGNWGGLGWPGGAGSGAQSGYLDGIWELTSGSLVIIKRSSARLYVSRERYQDFIVGYDQQRFWWTPRGGNTTTTYRYQMRDGRMVLRDSQGKMLLMRRRS